MDPLNTYKSTLVFKLIENHVNNSRHLHKNLSRVLILRNLSNRVPAWIILHYKFHAVLNLSERLLMLLIFSNWSKSLGNCSTYHVKKQTNQVVQLIVL